MYRLNINLIRFILLFSLYLGPISCSTGSNISQQNSAEGRVFISQMATVPLLNGVVPNAIATVNNDSNDTISLAKTTIIEDEVTLSESQQAGLFDISHCTNIAPHSSCQLKITPATTSGSFIIQLVYDSNDGKAYNAAQLISYTNNARLNNGFIYFNPGQLINTKRVDTVSIPVILGENYSEVHAEVKGLRAETQFICPANTYAQNSMCNIIINYKYDPSLSDTSTTPELLISGITADTKTQKNSSIILSLATSNAGNIITSTVNPIINPATSPSPTVTLFNNGASPVSNLRVYGITPLTINNSCGSTLAINSSCTFTVSSTSTTTGQSQVLIGYYDGISQIKELSINVYYSGSQVTPGLSITTNGWFMNTTLNTANYQGVYLVNTGNVTLSNLQFGDISAVAGMNYGGNGQTCVNGQSMLPGASCVMVISYFPTSAVAIGNTLNVNVQASYTNENGNQLSYVNGVSMRYSAKAATSGNFIAGGDYGALTASTTTPAGTWTVQNNTPFTGAATNISRMVNNGYLQVAGTGSGTNATAGFIYYAPSGMIWQSASGVTNAPPTGTAARAITGITYDSVNGVLVSNNSSPGDLYSANTTGWNAPLNNAFINSPFSLFNFGANAAYLAPASNATTSQQLGVSTNPKVSWTQVNPSGAARTYFAAISDGTRYCVLSTTKFVACANASGFTTASTWTQNATVISASTAANMWANNGSSSYVALGSTAPFVVYLLSPSNPATAGTWTSATTQPTAALTWVTYGAGLYVAVSAASPGLVWTSPTGSVWTQRTSGTANNPVAAPYGFVYYDGNNFWAAGTRVLRVSPDGINWSNAGISSMTYTYIGNSINYLAAGTAGAIASSANLTTWLGESSNTTAKLNSIECFNSNNCYAVGESGTLLFSSDGAGATWDVESAGSTQGINGVACGYSNCVVVGDNGIILVESTGSNNWVAASSGTAVNLNAVTFFSLYNTYVAVGNTGTILTSTDGQQWTTVNSGGNNLNSVACTYSNVGCMAVGVNGTVLTSLNGRFWTSQANATATSYGVSFLNGFWVVAQATGARYTADNSTTLTWNAITTNITNIAAMNLNTILAY